MIRISFIVPCYNVEGYLHRSLTSIVNSLIPAADYEIICVNDMSSDSTIDSLNEYAGKYSNIVVVDSKRHLGQSGVRNLALEKARGKYIWYVDADDNIVSESALALLEKCESECLDVLTFNFRDLDNDGVPFKETNNYKTSFCTTGAEFVKHNFGRGFREEIGFVWRFLYRRDYLIDNNILFPVDVSWEDSWYVPKALLSAARVDGSTLFGYDYWHNQGSLCRTFEKKYQGKQVYEFSIVAGSCLLRLSEEQVDGWAEKIVREIAVNDYINYLPVLLVRSNFKERKEFYCLLRRNHTLLNEIKPCMTGISRMLVNPIMGRLFSEMFSIAYKIKHAVK
ncbi:MAG: glycosyltransferase family 2 protein [Bacteroidia bacterium]|nr:glycosyltransferase family 2 protein [Bacteroidia bacterium]